MILRGTMLDNVTVFSPTGRRATGRVRLAETFNPSGGASELVLEVQPGPVQQLIAELHGSRAAAQQKVVEINGLKYEVDVVEMMDTRFQLAGGRVVLRVRAASPTMAGPMPQPRVDARRFPAPVRQEFIAFWSAKTPAVAAALERTLEQLETRARRGENVQHELTHVMQQQPDLAKAEVLLKNSSHYSSSTGSEASSGAGQVVTWIDSRGNVHTIVLSGSIRAG